MMKHAQSSADPSPERVELIRLIQGFTSSHINSDRNANGWFVLVEIERENGKWIRSLVEGGSTLLATERACLASVRSMLGQ